MGGDVGWGRDIGEKLVEPATAVRHALGRRGRAPPQSIKSAPMFRSRGALKDLADCDGAVGRHERPPQVKNNVDRVLRCLS